MCSILLNVFRKEDAKNIGVKGGSLIYSKKTKF